MCKIIDCQHFNKEEKEDHFCNYCDEHHEQKRTYYVCEICGMIKPEESIVKNVQEFYEVDGKKITIGTDIRFCIKCNIGVYDEILNQKTLKKIFAKTKEGS